MAEVLLIDLSSIAHPLWHMAGGDPNPDATAQGIVARVHALASGHEHVAVCCDSGRSFRHDLDATYKANRPERDEAFHHQLRLAEETLIADGFPLWKAPGFEADDVIATAAMLAVGRPDTDVLIASADKDLLQLVNDRIRMKRVKDGTIVDAAGVFAKFGVRPDQMRDYLTIVGDASDNVKGIRGLGEKKAAALLATFGSLEAVYAQANNGKEGLSPALLKALEEFRPRWETTRDLITLRVDVDLPFEDLFKPRESAAAKEFVAQMNEATPEVVPPVVLPPVVAEPKAMAVREPEVLPAVSEWDRQLEPRSLREAKELAVDMHSSRMFVAAVGNPQSALATILAGREYGLPAMASLRAFHNVDGKQTMAADLIRAVVLKSGKAKYFRPTERSATRATFETQRGDDPPVSLTFTIEEARMAWPKDDAAWLKSGWGKNPADMLVARAGAKLARLVYPDVVHGLYAPEELEAA